MAAEHDYYAIAFAVITAIGGVIGYIEAASWHSLVSGLLAGTALFYGERTSNETVKLITSLALLAFFSQRLVTGGKMMPAGLMSGLSYVAVLRYGRLFL